MPRSVVRHLVRQHAGQFRFVIRGLEQTPLDEQISARQREGVDFAGLQNRDVQRDLQIRIAGDPLRQGVDVILDLLVFQSGRQQSGPLQLLDGVLSLLDVVLLVGGDLPESDVLHVGPAPLHIGFIRDLLLGLLVERRPFLDEVQLGVEIVVGVGDRHASQGVGFALQQIEILNLAMDLLPVGVVEFRGLLFEVLLRRIDLFTVLLGVILEPRHAQIPSLVERVSLICDLLSGEVKLRSQFEQIHVRLLQVFPKRYRFFRRRGPGLRRSRNAGQWENEDLAQSKRHCFPK